MKRSIVIGGLLFLAVFSFALGTAMAKQEFYGTVQKMPASGYIGEWVISGRTVQVTKDTKLDQDEGPLQVGAYVEVEGVEHQGQFIATEIETKKRK